MKQQKQFSGITDILFRMIDMGVDVSAADNNGRNALVSKLDIQYYIFTTEITMSSA
jgi:hypothetical protein